MVPGAALPHFFSPTCGYSAGVPSILCLLVLSLFELLSKISQVAKICFFQFWLLGSPRARFYQTWCLLEIYFLVHRQHFLDVPCCDGRASQCLCVLPYRSTNPTTIYQGLQVPPLSHHEHQDPSQVCEGEATPGNLHSIAVETRPEQSQQQLIEFPKIELLQGLTSSWKARGN